VINPTNSHDEDVAIRTRPGILRIRKSLGEFAGTSYATARHPSPPTATPADCLELAKVVTSNARIGAHAGDNAAPGESQKDGTSADASAARQAAGPENTTSTTPSRCTRSTSARGAIQRCSPVCSSWRNTTAVRRHALAPSRAGGSRRRPAAGTSPRRLVGTTAVDDGLRIAPTGWKRNPEWSNPVKPSVTLTMAASQQGAAHHLQSVDDKPKDKAAIRHSCDHHRRSASSRLRQQPGDQTSRWASR